MSRSSSTIRMSWAMTLQAVRYCLCGSLCGCRMRSSRRDFLRVPSEYQTDGGAATLSVLQRKITTVIFHYLLDDSQAQPRPFAAGRHVRLGQALSSFLRQTLAVVLDDNTHRRAVVLQGQRNLASRQRSGRRSPPPLDRLGRILQDVGQDLTYLAAIADQRNRPVRQARDIVNIGIAVALKEKCLLAELLGILGLHRRAGHAGKG